MKPYFDIAVFIPLEEELEEFKAEFPSKKNLTSNGLYIHEVDSGKKGLSIAVIHQKTMGHAAAGDAAGQFFDKYDAGLVVCLGIAGGLSNDLKIGGVCYSGVIWDVYENSKATDVENLKHEDAMSLELSPETYDTPEEITVSMNYIRTQDENRSAYKAWQQARYDDGIKLIPDSFPGREAKKETLALPISLPGNIACGVVSKSKGYNKRLKGLTRDILAVETESGAIFRKAKQNNTIAVTIRGISDYADRGKTGLESATQGKARSFAAKNAVTFFKLQLDNSYFMAHISTLRSSGSALTLFDKTADLTTSRKSFHEQVAEEIDCKLSELSPEYRLQGGGYKIPVPRVRKVESFNTGDNDHYYDAIELREALDLSDTTFLTVPLGYPEQALPWVIGQEVLNLEINEMQAIPIIIDIDDVAAPKTFEKLATLDLSSLVIDPSFTPVFILFDAPAKNPRRAKWLQTEIEKHEGHKCILISSPGTKLIQESELSENTYSENYEVCDVSFSEVAAFVQRSFEMSSIESEVVAKRLWDTFTEFDLSAHPTYFAGIPKETLSALLDANHRVEVIQLAVMGFLTDLVVSDQAAINLSRRFRTKFLTWLVVEKHVEKRNFTQSQLLEKIEQIAALQDYDIDPASFLSDFRNKGILHYVDSRVEFSLSFMERYLLAKELSAKQVLADRYFDFSNFDFDSQVFDLYCELGPHDSIKQQCSHGMQKSLENLSKTKNDKHILLTNKVSPKFMKSFSNIGRLRDKIDNAVESVKNNESDRYDKQQILNLTERVRRTTIKRAKIENQKEDKKIRSELEESICWFLYNTSLLGSGAEHLLATEKRPMAANVAKLGSWIVDVWTQQRALVDFDSFREELAKDAIAGLSSKKMHKAIDEDEVEYIVSTMIDMFEGHTLADPTRRILGRLCENSRAKVLAISLKNAVVDDEFAKLLFAAWYTDVDYQNGRKVFAEEIKNIGQADFLRMTLSMHCLSRVYWNQSRKAERLGMLDFADELVKPISTSFDKGKIKRTIENME